MKIQRKSRENPEKNPEKYSAKKTVEYRVYNVRTTLSGALWKSELRAVRMEFLEARAIFCILSTAFVGEGDGDGRYAEGVNGNLKLYIHGTELAPDKARLLVEHQRES